MDTQHHHHEAANSPFNNYDEHWVKTNDNELLEEYAEKQPAVPVKRPFYKKKKYWIICSVISAIIIVVVVLLIIFVAFPKIAQSLMNQSKIDVNTAQISFSKPSSLESQTYSKRDGGDNMNTTFYMNMESSLKNTGPFSADIKFHNPINVLYKDQILGDIWLYNNTHISGGHGSLNAMTPFVIRDEAAFASFAKDMLAVDEFKWILKGKLDITALTRTATVDLNKEITLNGMNGFPNVKINSFQMPGDDPTGGILVELGTVLTSPSPIGVQLGTIAMAIGYDGISLGTVKAENVQLQKGDNNIPLKGTLVPHNDTATLDKIGTLFSNYVAGKTSNTSAIGISCAPDGVNPISWLSEGFKTVKLNVALGAPEPLKIIQSVSMGYLDLKFDSNTPYAPLVNAPIVNANFQIPFGFSLNITEVNQNITMAINTSSTETADFAVLQVPFVPAISDQNAGTLQFGIKDSNIAGITGKEQIFNKYTYELTASNNYTFMISGNASTKTNTPIGPITLGGIQFTVPTQLHGLQFLNSSATVINSLDVTGGTTENLLLSINVTMTNPSDFSISTGDVSFIMGSDGTDLGVVTLQNLTLARGNNQVSASATFDPKSSDVGQNLLSTFVMGQDNSVIISGYANSTNIASLVDSLSAISLGSTLPGLKTALIQGGRLTVRSDVIQTGLVDVTVSIANPFSAGLSINKVVAAATYTGMPIGNIDQDISSSPFVIPGKSVAKSQALSMTMNVEPASVALLLRTLAKNSNLDTHALDALLGLGGFQIAGQEYVDASPDLFSSFNISSYVMNAMKALKVDLTLSSGIDIGQYSNDLAFSQRDVAIASDSSVTMLIPIVGQPIVQQIVDGSVLSFDTIILSAPTNNDFTVQMKGKIANAGPMDATIMFPTPLNVAWEGMTLGQVSMPDINSKAGVGASFDVTGKFTIKNTDDMASFATFMINNGAFEWEITTQDVSVNALGYTFSKITMQKYVTLSGANGFKDAVTINKFDLPSNDPAGGITLTAETTIKNPSQVGFNLSGVAFESSYKGTVLGPLGSNGAAVFPPQGTASISLKGRLVPQKGEGLKAVAEIFDNYLSANDSIINVKGVSGSGPNGVVNWLSTAFKTLTIPNVVMPGPKVKPQLIPGITMKQMTLDLTKDPWAPPTSSSNVEAQLKSPFGFPLSVSQLEMNVMAQYQGADVASLNVPAQKAITSPSGLVSTQFSDIPFKVQNKEIFTGFVQLLTMSPSVTFGLKGTSNAIAETAIGAISLHDIGFNVDTALAGFANFGGSVKTNSIVIAGGTPEYTLVNLGFSMANPSNITINVGDINFDVIMNESGSVVGRVYVENVIIPPGLTEYTGEMHLGEKTTDKKSIGQLFSNYLTSANTSLTITGSSESTKIAPLVPALSSVKLNTEMSGIAANLISQIQVKGSLLGMLSRKEATSVVSLANPMDAPYQIKSVQASVTFTPSSATIPSFTVGTIDYQLPNPVTVPAKGTATSDEWPVVVGEASASQLLALITDKNKYLDVQQNVTVIVGKGYETEMYYYQNKVPFSISFGSLLEIGITPDQIAGMELPSNITEQGLHSILAGKGTTSTATAATSSTVTATTIVTTTTDSSQTSKDSMTEALPTKTEQEKSAPTSTETFTTTANGVKFKLPF
ncbi:hypothetical protein BDF20DRAFT_822209 [Mycotypha africana]|uniref:uncharacterized protein n=1 Tax=Mycotypha africana TaxID=64632 RepID=UPI00230017C3|nr:uncharacterized protein BDF20DRAFT_822209 [Mycotypha africana]KAI8975148.1 hypothetical protein BDF20DRAFT_822209 [Mycotypha africana]